MSVGVGAAAASTATSSPGHGRARANATAWGGANATYGGGPRATWDDVARAIDGYRLIGNVRVDVGNGEGGIVFSHTKGNVLPTTSGVIYSSSKWVAGVAILGAVGSGALGLDDPASQHLRWWTDRPEDPRSAVTLRHLLGFTSGYSEASIPAGCAGASFEDCCESIYQANTLVDKPGSVYKYNEVHLQLAGCVAVAASGMTAADLTNRYAQYPHLSDTRARARTHTCETTQTRLQDRWAVTPKANPQPARGVLWCCGAVVLWCCRQRAGCLTGPGVFFGVAAFAGMCSGRAGWRAHGGVCHTTRCSGRPSSAPQVCKQGMVVATPTPHGNTASARCRHCPVPLLHVVLASTKTK